MNVTYFTKPDTGVKKVVLFYPGRFPKATKPNKDVTLPARLWPNAELVIYGNFKKPYSKNIEYFNQLFAGLNFRLVDRTLHDALEFDDADVLFIHHENYNLFGGVVQDRVMDRALLTERWKGKIFIYYNDELFVPFTDFRKFLDGRAKSESFNTRNPGVLDRLPYKNDWSNVTIIGNENRIRLWLHDYMCDDVLKGGINLCYLSDFILYALPKERPTIKQNGSKIGCYVPLFTGERIKVCNELFSDRSLIYFGGSRSDELKEEIRGDGKYVKNHELGALLLQYGFTVYLGKARFSQYLGATFYEPLLHGLPILMWEETDPDHVIFPGMDCYFNNEDDIRRIVSGDLGDLYQKQLSVFWPQ